MRKQSYIHISCHYKIFFQSCECATHKQETGESCRSGLGGPGEQGEEEPGYGMLMISDTFIIIIN